MSKFLKGPIFRIVVSFVALGFIGYSLREHLREAFRILATDVVWTWFLCSAVAFLIAQAIMAVRLFMLYKTQDLSISYNDTLYLCVVGLFFNLFLPSAVGGDVAKIYYSYKHTGKQIESTTAIILDRLVGFVVIISIALVALFFLKGEINHSGVNVIVYIFLAVVIATIVFFSNPRMASFLRVFSRFFPAKILGKIVDLYHAISSCRHHRGILFFAVTASFLGQFFYLSSYYLIALSLGVDISFGVFFLLVPLVAIVSMAPSLGGLGVREAGVVGFFSFYMEPGQALALSLLVDILIYGSGLLAGAVYALGGGLKKNSLKSIETVE